MLQRYSAKCLKETTSMNRLNTTYPIIERKKIIKDPDKNHRKESEEDAKCKGNTQTSFSLGGQ